MLRWLNFCSHFSMKKLLPSLLVLFLAAALSSCSMEKRTYRNGWYIDRSSSSSNIHNLNSDQNISENFAEGKKTSVNIQPASSSDSVSSTQTENQPINVRREIKSIFQSEHSMQKAVSVLKENSLSKDKKKDPPMTYAEARKSMAEKGCAPNSLVMSTYYMTIASVACVWFGVGLLILLPIAFIMSIFATNAAAKEGSCADENLAIIAAARRILLLELLWVAIVGIFTALLVLAILQIIGSNGGLH